MCIAEKSDPPVCKIVDYGKMRYEQERKKKDQKKKAKTNEIKEVKMSYKIGEGDYQVRRRAATKFIKNGNRVKLAIQRGRRAASFFSSFSARDAFSPAGSAAASSSTSPSATSSSRSSSTTSRRTAPTSPRRKPSARAGTSRRSSPRNPEEAPRRRGAPSPRPASRRPRRRARSIQRGAT